MNGRMTQDWVYQVKYLTNIVQNDQPESYDVSFCQKIIKAFEVYPFHESMLKLAIHCVRDYGFGVLIMLKKLFSRLGQEELRSYYKDFYQIQLLAGQLLEGFPHDNFPELRFLKVTSKTMKSQIKQDHKYVFLRVFSTTKRQSRKAISYIIKLKEFQQRLAKVNEATFSDVEKTMSDLKTFLFIETPTLNLFEKYHLKYALDDITKELSFMRKRFNLSNSQKNYLDMCINDIRTNKHYLKQNQSAYTHVRQESSNEEVNSNSLYSRKDDLIQISDNDQTKNYIKTQVKDNERFGTSSVSPQMSAYNKLLRINPTVPDHKPIPICCRTFFSVNQVISEAESDRRQYKQYHFPFTDILFERICGAMVGFLNYYGGTIYIGIKEDTNRLRKAIGITLNEKEKEDLMFQIRQFSGKIHPDIVLVKMYKVKFVPVKNCRGQYIPGRYVVKIIVEMGRPREVYYYHLNDQVGSKVCFRTENEVLVRESKNQLGKIIDFFKKRLERPLEPKKEHEGDCPEPEVGQSYI